MAAITRVFTIRRAAEILGRDEDLLWDLSDQLDPEDGRLWIADVLGRINDHPALRLDELLPWNCKARAATLVA